jgi:hypothetical protein
VGSALYLLGGFGLPFWVIGSLATVVGVYLIIAMPSFHDSQRGENVLDSVEKPLKSHQQMVTSQDTRPLRLSDHLKVA